MPGLRRGGSPGRTWWAPEPEVMKDALGLGHFIRPTVSREHAEVVEPDPSALRKSASVPWWRSPHWVKGSRYGFQRSFQGLQDCSGPSGKAS